MIEAGYYRDLLSGVLRGRKVVVAVDVLQGATPIVGLLREIGAQRPFVLAGVRGTGPEPSADDADVHLLGTTAGKTIMQTIRGFESALRDLPRSALEALEAYDPDRSALVAGTLFTEGTEVAGRRLYGGRPAAWAALEDKIVVDELFDAAGIARPPSEVAAIADAAAAHVRLERGLGTAWAGDAREGWWGGAEYLRWVRTDADRTDAEAYFAAHCDAVRVMPFLEGIPCSIHGMVFDDTVTAFRPVEMLTLRRPDANKLAYAGLATYWDPPDGDREAMRAAARVIGALLRERVDYRGAFTMDGVLTEDGFLPTELNTRPGAGLTPQVAASGVPVALLNKMLIEREGADYRPDELEELVVTRADERRGGGAYTVFERKRTETETFPVARRDGVYEVLDAGAQGDGTITIGPSGVGGLVRYEPDPAKLLPGASFAPVAVEVFEFTDERFGTGLGRLEAARSVR